MLLRSLLRATTAAAPIRQSEWQLPICRSMATKVKKPVIPTKGKKPQPKFDPKEKKPEEMQATNPEFSLKEEAELRRRQLAEDEKNPALDVGPDGRPLFTSKPSLSLLTKDDTNTYFKFSMEELKEVLPEGLPMGMIKEFEESSRTALLVRQCFIDLRDNFRRAADPSLVVNSKAPKAKKQIVLDGLVSCGKSIALAMLVHWARKEGFLKYNKSCLARVVIRCQFPKKTTLYQLVEAGLINTPLLLLEWIEEELSKVTSMPVLIAVDQYNSWFTFTDYEEPVTVRSCRPIHARELATLHLLLSEIYALEPNASLTLLSNRIYSFPYFMQSFPVIVGKYLSAGFLFGVLELLKTAFDPQWNVIETGNVLEMLRLPTLVKAFRSMMHDDMMVGAFSHSTAVGKLRQELPDVPTDARVHLPRYSVDEADTVCHYYLRSVSLDL
ncbi:UNVERIFIED_CONTAM: hypothetical protein Sradi_0211400 [Sesamum radiatum]|uniref:Small ribosomal subunit protein mS29 n=1 Tax=Sesamum radiatum TaxID=300843 RepID=A0AAW2W1J7_SESRA